MHWIVAALGLLGLILLGLAARKPVPPFKRDVGLGDTAKEHLAFIAQSAKPRGMARLSSRRRLLHLLEASIRFLDATPESEWLPSVRWLCENGRFLQEEVASALCQVRGVGKLPRVEHRLPRVLLFAREALGHSTADITIARLKEWVSAWQSIMPFTEQEITVLPLALRLMLVQAVCELAQGCAQDQRAARAAQQTQRLIEKRKLRAAKRSIMHFRGISAFWERLMSGEMRNHEWLMEQCRSLDIDLDALISAEQLRQTEVCQWIGNAISSLRTLEKAPWHRILEEMSTLDGLLRADRTYPRMDRESRAYYRTAAAELARKCRRSEKAVASAALALAQDASSVKGHVGYYLVDEGRAQLLRSLRSPGLLWREKVSRLYRLFDGMVFALLAVLGIWLSVPLVLLVPFALVFRYTIQQLINAWLTRRIPPRMVPRIKVDHLADDERTLVVFPTLLTSAKHALAMVKHLSTMHQAEPDPNLHFLLLGDFQDSLTGMMVTDGEIVQTASAAIEALCADTGHNFLYLQRERVYSLSDHIHHSRERKRGGLETLMKLLEGKPVEDSFAFSTFPLEDLRGQYRYIITLDSDTILPPGAALRMVGAMLHPLQRDRVGILQPRMETAAHTIHTAISRILGGAGGSDAYNRLISNVDQDVLKRGTFMGKGIIDPRLFLDATDTKILPGTVLSHDLLEGELAGCAYVSDIVLYDSQPQSLHGFLTRLHRWTRGDWQLLPYLLPFSSVHKAVGPIGKYKMIRNLLRSFVAPSQLCLLVYAAASRQLWLAVAVLLPFLGKAFLCRLGVLPLEAAMQLDAIVRTLYRLFYSHQHLLSWTTAAQANHSGRPPMRYFTLSMGTAGAFALLSFVPGSAFGLCWLLAAIFAAFPFLLSLWEREDSPLSQPTGYMRDVLTRLARSTLTFFETAITQEDHALPPDNVQLEPNRGIAHRTSPTNIGLYLCSLIAAEKLGLLSADEIAQRISETVSTLEVLPKWEGLLYNWLDTKTLQPLEPKLVSSVDCGNLAACLLTCAQGLRALLPKLNASYHELPARVDALAYGMHLDRLYDPDAELFYIGFTPSEGKPTAAHYDLLASEARLLSFVGIMMGQIPVKHWSRLGRQWTKSSVGAALMSYSGTMFEYLLPMLFQPSVPKTLLDQTCRTIIRWQSKHRLAGAFGVSESGYYAFDAELAYQYKAFGLPRLALSGQSQADVLAPYASLLSLPLDLKGAFRNLQKLQVLGMEGPLGMFEAADFDPARTDGAKYRIVRSHMAHHQGMILCAICNALEEQYLVRLFSGLPRAQAHRLLLEERPLRGRPLIRRPLQRRLTGQRPSRYLMQRPAQPLSFPVDAHLLSGCQTTVLIDAQGGGFIIRNGIMLTRFRDRCHVPSGLRLYLRDSGSGASWTVTDPHLSTAVHFETAQAVFEHQRYDLHTQLRIWVDPLTGAVLHALTLENQSNTERLMETCSYFEPALAAQNEDQAHPAFQNLFVQTQRLGKHGVAAIRRAKEPDAPVHQIWHMLSSDQPFTMFRVQTDRMAFLGRNRSFHAPRALSYPISAVADSVGNVIEPCLSLRAQWKMPPKGKCVLLFATHLPDSNASFEAFQERYEDVPGALRSYDIALTRGLALARQIGMEPTLQSRASQMVGALAYSGQPMQYHFASAGLSPRSRLWALGISGDLPILLVDVKGGMEDEAIQALLKCHAFFRLSGMWIDLVFLCKGARSAQQIERVMDAGRAHALRGKNGGVYLFDRLSDADAALLRASARLVLDGPAMPDERMSVQAKALYVCRFSSTPTELPTGDPLLYENGYGGFTQPDGNYQITLPPGRQVPAPWCNVLCSPTFGTLASESGLLFTYAANSSTGRLTHWPNDAVSPQGEENVFVRDEDSRSLWSVTRMPLGHGMPVRITHEPGVTTYESSTHGLFMRLVCFTDVVHPAGLRTLTIRNDSPSSRHLTLFHTFIWEGGWVENTDEGCLVYDTMRSGLSSVGWLDESDGAVISMSAGAFQGLWSTVPFALSAYQRLPSAPGNTTILPLSLELAPGESCTRTVFLLHEEEREQITSTMEKLRMSSASERLLAVRKQWAQRLGVLHFDLPDPALSLMLNRWLPYQVQASRLWMRAGFYQAGGAIGFRDQLQDMLSMLHTQPEVVRAYLLLCAAHQFEEGDVQHWWHPPRMGVRTRISDDKLFLPYVTAAYTEATGDESILEEAVPYLHAEPLRADEKDRYFEPNPSTLTEPLYKHCLRAIESVQLGAHGLPLMRGGDWNDGMNRVGGEHGESIWLGMFLCETLRKFAPLCDEATRENLLHRREMLLDALDRHAWDGKWYLRAWYSDGKPLGSQQNAACRIDLLSQSWAVICGVSRERCVIAMENAWRLLFERDIGAMKLFTPPFDGDTSPGYIAGYLPGVRENGGQYTHAACWGVSALYQVGQEERAWELAMALLPIHHASSRQLAMRYRTEPYIMAADIYTDPQQRGRGGWTWYTGSAGWYQTVMLQLLGFQKQGDCIRLRPVVPQQWERFTITYHYGTSTYHLHAARDCALPVLDGSPLSDGKLILVDDGKIHEATFPIRSSKGDGL